MIPILLETERLVIKNETVEDFVKVHEYDFNYLMNIEGIFEFVKRDPDEVRSWFPDETENSPKKDSQENFLETSHYLIIYLKNNMEPIGNLGFDRNDLRIKSTMISCYVHPNHWGHGYMQEALIECMQYLFDNGFENIIYGYYEGNIKSQRLCEKIGFEPYKTQSEGNFLGNKSTVYENIMSKERFNQLYQNKNISKKI